MDGEDQQEESLAPEGYRLVDRFRYSNGIFILEQSLRFLIGISFDQLVRWGLIAQGVFQHVAGWELDGLVLLFFFTPVQ